MKKDFKYTVKTSKGNIIYQEIVTFGSEERPFPEDWKDSPITQMSLANYKEKVLQKCTQVTIEEGSELDEIS